MLKNRSIQIKIVKDTPEGPVEEEVLSEVKGHFERNKQLYVGIAGGFLFAANAYFVTRGKSRGNANVTIRPFSFFSKQINDITVITTPHVRKGPPSWAVWNPRTGEEWLTQGKAALANGCSPSRMSDHLNGKLPHIGGEVFERIAINANI